MTGISIGPFVLAGGRLAAVVALAVFLLALESVAWRRRRGGEADSFGRWPTLVIAGWVVAARAGYVFANGPAFATAPADIVKVWQGGFSTIAGGYGATFVIAVAALFRRGAVLPLASAAALAALVSSVTMIALTDRTHGASTLPTAVFTDLSGHAMPLGSPGTPVIVNLWASWCGPCRREMPMMQAIAATTPDVEIRFVNQGEPPDVIVRFLQSANLSVEDIRLDPDRSLMRRYAAFGLPTTLFFRADGTLAKGVVGETSRAEILRQIKIITTGGKE